MFGQMVRGFLEDGAMDSILSAELATLLARALVLLHSAVVGVTVAGGIAVVLGRFSRVHRRDYFAIAFFACSMGQLLSLVLTGGCIFTQWERQLLSVAGQPWSFDGTFLQRFFPWLPDRFATTGVPCLAFGALGGAIVQVVFAVRRGAE
jgi:hypothetical protein